MTQSGCLRGRAPAWQRGAAGPRRVLRVRASAGRKEIWLQTSDKSTFTTALESGGVSAFVFGPDPRQRALAEAWAGLARFRALLQDDRGALTERDGGAAAGEVVRVDGAEAARALEARVAAHQRSAAAAGGAAGAATGKGPGAKAQEASGAATSVSGRGSSGVAADWALVMDASDWKVIPAENLVALAQPSAAGAQAPPLRLLAAASSAGEARLMLEALEAGTAGVLLRTEEPGQVRELVSYVSRRAASESDSPANRLPYIAAEVTAVRALGVGDRACVDLASLMQPGEGLLVGSFARSLALVQAEAEQTEYIASRPFRVNAGPVHAYVAAPGGRTRYLSELRSGDEVLIADAAGRSRPALVGRVKIERRPLVVVELRCPDGSPASLMLQNAETVKLLGPAPAPAPAPAPPPAAAQASASTPAPAQAGEGTADKGAAGTGGPGAGGAAGAGAGATWRAVSVSALAPGDRVFVLQAAAARHTGIAIEEFILEK
ncbi:hypothetical protein HYH03_010414 [Edaphochlamys debaryana]|uniref:3-dehydroquinate synthase n=1 Tax=Edaphochlamys debaryana TaxID=47281 RepID=A0A835XWP2_9CHLO|nr:hypothetical protein HYH03_010414 [Edaphochlamys debaryana]|eukprot:KAG2491204.1 hypothetical protein HYH03_010414 [Edaphochlamys debaryana]